MTSEQTSDPTNTRGDKPSHEKWIPTAIILFVLISIGMIALGAAGGT